MVTGTKLARFRTFGASKGDKIIWGFGGGIYRGGRGERRGGVGKFFSVMIVAFFGMRCEGYFWPVRMSEEGTTTTRRARRVFLSCDDAQEAWLSQRRRAGCVLVI